MNKICQFVFLFTFTVAMLLMFNTKVFALNPRHATMLSFIGYDVDNNSWNPAYNLSNYKLRPVSKEPRFRMFDFGADTDRMLMRFLMLELLIEHDSSELERQIGQQKMLTLKKEYAHLCLFGVGYDIMTNQWNPKLNSQDYVNDKYLASDRVKLLERFLPPHTANDEISAQPFSTRLMQEWIGPTSFKKLKNGYNFLRRISPSQQR